MPEIKLKARIQNKYESLEEWNKLAKGEFIPLKGEICYGIDAGMSYHKIGDGKTDFVDLPWLLNQADNEENDETSPAYIKNRLAYPEYTEVSEDEQNLYIDKFIALELFEDKLITPVADLTSVWGDDVLNYFPETSNIIIGYPYDSGGVIYTDQVDDLLNQYNQFQIKMQGEETEKIWDFAYNTDVLKTSTSTLEGYTISCLGNNNWANMLMNFIGDTISSPIEYFTPEESTDKYCFVFAGPIVEDEIAMLMTYMCVDCDYYKPNTVTETDTSTTPETVITSYEYPFAFKILARGQMHTIDDKYLGDVRSDFDELKGTSKNYIKNRYGINTIIDMTDEYAQTLGQYRSTITAGPYDSLLGQTLRGEMVHEDFASPDLMHMLETCTVTIDGQTWHDCPVFQRSIIGSSDVRNAYYIGNPVHISNNTNKWLSLLADLEEDTMVKGYKFYEEIDNNLPFVIPYCPGSSSPLYDGGYYKFPKTYENKQTFSIEIIPERLRLTTNVIRKDILPQETIIGYLNNELNSILLNSSYEASGANSLAAGNQTKATASEAMALGNNTEASGIHSLSFGENTKAQGKNSLAGGLNTTAIGDISIALGDGSIANGNNSFSAGCSIIKEYNNISIQDNYNIILTTLDRTDYNQIRLYYSSMDSSTQQYTPWIKINNIYVTDGQYRIYIEKYLSEYNSDFTKFVSLQVRKTNYTQEDNSFIFGIANRTNGIGSTAFGLDNTAKSAYSFVIGKNNKIGDEAFIIGNGSSNDNRSNAMKVDWNGNSTFAGSVESTSIILASPNGTKFNITVNDDGTLSTTQI